MVTIDKYLERERTKGKSVAWFVKGYYLQSGGVHGFDTKIPIFEYDRQDKDVNPLEKPFSPYKVLIDYLGSFMWINCFYKDLHFGYGGKNSPSKEGKRIYAKLETLKVI